MPGTSTVAWRALTAPIRNKFYAKHVYATRRPLRHAPFTRHASQRTSITNTNTKRQQLTTIPKTYEHAGLERGECYEQEPDTRDRTITKYDYAYSNTILKRKRAPTDPRDNDQRNNANPRTKTIRSNNERTTDPRT